MFENRRWLVIPTSLTSSIDFSQVLESSADTLRLSVDGTQTFVKYEVNEITASYEEYYPDAEDPNIMLTSSIEAGVYGRPDIYDPQYTEYNHTDILALLSTEVWASPMEERV